MIHFNPERSRVITAQFFRIDDNGELDFHMYSHMDPSMPLDDMESVSAYCDPRVMLLRLQEREQLHFGGESGFAVLGRHYAKYFFRVGVNSEKTVFCDTESLVNSGKVNPTIRASIQLIQHGELEQFGLDALRTL